MNQTEFTPSSHPQQNPADAARQRSDQELPKDIPYKKHAKIAEQYRSLLESQRQNIERERAAFAEERKLWEMERSILKERIAHLEANSSAGSGYSKLNSQQNMSGDDQSKADQANSNHSHAVWEGPVTSFRPTREFYDEGHPPVESNSIPGFGLRSSFNVALSPKSEDLLSAQPSIPVPGEKVDKDLDGIMLKSTALHPEIVAKVTSPSTTKSSPSHPRSDQETASTRVAKGKAPRKLSRADLEVPEQNLTRDAGHTPMAVLGSGSEVSSSVSDTADDNLTSEEPREPVVTQDPAFEDSDPVINLEDDPALTGPLSLKNDPDADNPFLQELNQKLLAEARKAVGESPAAAEDNKEEEEEDDDDDEPEPELRLKDTTNFGTAYGSTEIGKI